MAEYALSWNRSELWAEKFRAAGISKPAGRAISNYHSSDRKQIEATAEYINELAPEMACGVEVFR